MRRYIWAFQTNDSKRWIVIAANPPERPPKARFLADGEVPTTIKRSPRAKINRAEEAGPLELDLYEQVVNLARSRKLKVGQRFHVGWMENWPFDEEGDGDADDAAGGAAAGTE